MEIQRVAVIGTGLMGHGIAQSFAMHGYQVDLLSRSKSSLDNSIKNIKWSLQKLVEKGNLSIDTANATLSRILPKNSYEEGIQNADLVLETIKENLNLKKELISKIDKIARVDTIIASNTSTLSITEMGKVTERPEKTIGMHWFNPPQLTKLVEVIRGDQTSDDTVSIIMDLSKNIGKIPILCKKDVRGFIVSRILVSVFNEAFWTFSRGEASMLEIDSSIKYSAGFPMGWFELIDFVGIDTEYDVSKILYEAHGERYFPHTSLTEPLMKEKKLGRKTGLGFYDWTKSRPIIPPELMNKYNVERSWAVAINEAAHMINEDVTSPESIDLGMKLGTGWPFGPCEYADKKGLDVILNILEKAYNLYKIEIYRPCTLFEKYLKKGWKGKKTGRGFYTYK